MNANILQLFYELTLDIRVNGLPEKGDKRVTHLNKLLKPYNLQLYEHHDEYLWVDIFIANIESPIDGL